jgi:hypothetical protein
MTSGWEVVMAISTAVIAASAIAVAAVIVSFGIQLNRILKGVQGRIDPIIQRLRDATENIRGISSTLRTDAEMVSDTVGDANDAVRHALTVTEHKLHELNALLSVVQGEAEDLFVTAASVVRGVRGGAAALRGRNGMEFASDELDAADEADDLDIQEESDGHHDDPEPTAEASPFVAAPRVRPRARSRRRS